MFGLLRRQRGKERKTVRRTRCSFHIFTFPSFHLMFSLLLWGADVQIRDWQGKSSDAEFTTVRAVANMRKTWGVKEGMGK